MSTDLILQSEQAKLERAKIEERMLLAQQLATVSLAGGAIACADGAGMRRLAIFFSESTIWPESFQGKPANCFVCLTMAARLGCDPTMLAQNLYEHKGRWAMQSKMSTALATASGVFQGEIWHTWEGDGDDLKCTAHAVMAKSGKEVSLSLTRAEAKAWGWYEPKGQHNLPSKWVQMEEGMFLYRTSDWLIRHYAPHVTLGLLSADELEDIEDAPVRSTPAAKSDKAAKADKKHALPPPTERPRDNGALGLVGVGAGESVDTTPIPATALKSTRGETDETCRVDYWCDLMYRCETSEQCIAIWKSMLPYQMDAVGPTGMEKIKKSAAKRNEELRNGTSTDNSRPTAQAGLKVAEVEAAGPTATEDGGAAPPPVKKGRGRPRKAKDAEIAAEQANYQAEQDADFARQRSESPEDAEAATSEEPGAGPAR